MYQLAKLIEKNMFFHRHDNPQKLVFLHEKVQTRCFLGERKLYSIWELLGKWKKHMFWVFIWNRIVWHYLKYSERQYMWGVGSLVRSWPNLTNEPPRAKQKLWFYHCDFEMSGLAATSTYLSISGQVHLSMDLPIWGLSAVSTCFCLANQEELYSLWFSSFCFCIHWEEFNSFVDWTRVCWSFWLLDLLQVKYSRFSNPGETLVWKTHADCYCSLEREDFLLDFHKSPDIEQCSCYEDVYDKAKFLCQLPLSSWPWMVETYGLSALDQRLARIFIFKRICLPSFFGLQERTKVHTAGWKFCLNKILTPNWKQLKLVLCSRTEGGWKAVVFESFGTFTLEERERWPFLPIELCKAILMKRGSFWVSWIGTLFGSFAKARDL